MKIVKSNSIEKKEKIEPFIFIKSGLSPKQANPVSFFMENHFPYIKVGTLNDNNKIIEKNNFFSNSNKNKINNAVIFPKRGAAIFTNKVAIIKEDSFIDTNLMAISSEKINLDYLYYYLKWYKLSRIADTGAIPQLNNKHINNLKIPILKKEEQEKIAQVLSQQEEQVNNIQKLIEKLEKRNQYYAERLLSGELRVREDENNLLKIYKNESWKEVSSKINKSGNILSPQDWSLIKLENIFIGSVGGEYGKALNNLNQNLKTKVITLHVFSGKDTEKSVIDRAIDSNKLKNRLIYNGDIVIEKSGGTENCSVGRVYLAENITEPTTSVNFTNILKIDNENYDSKYIYELLKFFHLRRVAAKYEQKTVGIANLKQSEYFKLKYIFPKKEEQILISKFIKQLELSVFEMKKLLEIEQKRFEWLSDALLSGEYQIVD